MLEGMLLQLLIILALLIALDVAALRWGYDSRTAVWLEELRRPDL
jgi:hypothetical protein